MIIDEEKSVDHDLKLSPEHFNPIVSEMKKAEFRINDRGFKIDQLVRLRVWENGVYTGARILVRIKHVVDCGAIDSDLADYLTLRNYVVLSIQVLNSCTDSNDNE